MNYSGSAFPFLAPTQNGVAGVSAPSEVPQDMNQQNNGIYPRIQTHGVSKIYDPSTLHDEYTDDTQVGIQRIAFISSQPNSQKAGVIPNIEDEIVPVQQQPTYVPRPACIPGENAADSERLTIFSKPTDRIILNAQQDSITPQGLRPIHALDRPGTSSGGAFCAPKPRTVQVGLQAENIPHGFQDTRDGFQSTNVFTAPQYTNRGASSAGIEYNIPKPHAGAIGLESGIVFSRQNASVEYPKPGVLNNSVSKGLPECTPSNVTERTANPARVAEESQNNLNSESFVETFIEEDNLLQAMDRYSRSKGGPSAFLPGAIQMPEKMIRKLQVRMRSQSDKSTTVPSTVSQIPNPVPHTTPLLYQHLSYNPAHPKQLVPNTARKPPLYGSIPRSLRTKGPVVVPRMDATSTLQAQMSPPHLFEPTPSVQSPFNPTLPLPTPPISAIQTTTATRMPSNHSCPHPLPAKLRSSTSLRSPISPHSPISPCIAQPPRRSISKKNPRKATAKKPKGKPSTPATTAAKKEEKRKSRTYTQAVASQHCHICSRRPTLAFPHVVCGNLLRGKCRKTICTKCFHQFRWDLQAARDAPPGTWECSHCRGECPQRAQCVIYNRTSDRRRMKMINHRKRKKGEQGANLTENGGRQTKKASIEKADSPHRGMIEVPKVEELQEVDEKTQSGKGGCRGQGKGKRKATKNANASPCVQIDLEAEAEVGIQQREPGKCLASWNEGGAQALLGSLQDAAQDDKVAGNEWKENGIGWQVGEKRQRRPADGNQEVEGIVYSLGGALDSGTFPDLELNNSREEAFGLWAAGETIEVADLACGGLGLDDQDVDIASVL